MNSIKLIKRLLFEEEMKITELARLLTEKTGKKYSRPSLSTRIHKGRLKYDEVQDILEILGYKIKIEKTEKA